MMVDRERMNIRWKRRITLIIDMPINRYMCVMDICMWNAGYKMNTRLVNVMDNLYVCE